MAYQPKPGEIAGVDIYGDRQPDGTIKLGARSCLSVDDRTVVNEFPTDIEVCGSVYTLEFVRENEWEGRAKVAAADPNDLRLRICWGVYV